MSLLLIDLSYQTYRAAAAHPNLTSEGRFTGGLYGFLQFFGKAVRETGATRVVFACDTKPYRRSAEYPDYKRLRRKERDPELAARQDESMAQVRELLYRLGFYLSGAPGFESDDVIADLGLRYRHRFPAVWAASSDSDLFQLLWVPNFAIYRTDARTAVRGADLVDCRGRPTTPQQYMLATALMGTHNEVAGIEGVGEKTAFDAAHDPAKLRQLMDRHRDVVERNLRLIALPHRELPKMALPEHGRYDPRALYRELGRYDIETTDAVARAFDAVKGGPR